MTLDSNILLAAIGSASSVGSLIYAHLAYRRANEADIKSVNATLAVEQLRTLVLVNQFSAGGGGGGGGTMGGAGGGGGGGLGAPGGDGGSISYNQ